MDYVSIAQTLSKKLNKDLSPHWIEIVHKLASKKMPNLEHLKPAIVGQWILECGRGSTNLFLDHWNPAGMKYRKEMEGYATSVYYKTKSEPSGGAYFCKFKDPETAVDGYFQFLSRAPYNGWSNHIETAFQWLAFVAPIWCPAGYRPKWKREHNGVVYHEYVMEYLYNEAVETLKAVGWKTETTPNQDKVVSWFKTYKAEDSATCIVAYAQETPKAKIISKLKSEIIPFLEKYPNAYNIVVADSDEEIPEIEDAPTPDPIPTDKPLKGKKVLVDAGHSKNRPGAHGLPPDYPGEWEHNVLAAAIVTERLKALGADVTYEDPDPDNLEYMGNLAKGKDLAIYIHHNAFDKDGVDEGTGIYMGTKSSTESIAWATKANTKMAKAIGNRDRGIKLKNYTVLGIGNDVGCPCVILPELYFIDDYGNASITEKKTTLAAQSLVESCIEYLIGKPTNPNPDDGDMPTLVKGNKGQLVKRLQRELNEAGYSLSVDGDFGSKTEQAVKSFQSQAGLEVDGIVGPKTWKALLENTKPIVTGNVREKLAKIAEKHALANFNEADGSYNYFRKDFIPPLPKSNWAWCAAFVHKCLEEASGRDIPIDPKTGPATFALCETFQQWAISKGYWFDTPKHPNPPTGSIVLFDWQGATYPDNDWESHIGVLLRKEGSAYICAEGNVSDGTRIKKRYAKNIQGFIVLPDDFVI